MENRRIDFIKKTDHIYYEPAFLVDDKALLFKVYDCFILRPTSTAITFNKVSVTS